ncbi:ATP-binding cassette sub-family E member 1 (Ribonuclease 4 inhibitor), partial [Aphelenchoides avenae]
QPPDWPTILAHFRGSELQNYFTKILEEKFKALIKPQYVDQIPRSMKIMKTVEELLTAKCDRDNIQEVAERLELINLMQRKVDQLSGGELQRFAIAMAIIQNADIYMFDEPSSYLDVRQRLEAAKIIRDVVTPTNYVLVVEHDLAVLDYLSDFVSCLYGAPGAYGVVTMPFGVREGINVFLDGFIPTENMRFRDSSLSFKVTDQLEREATSRGHNKYPDMQKTLGDFHLTIEKGQFSDSEIIVLLGENGTGKTTMIRMLAGQLQPDEGSEEVPELSISYKPQKIAPKFEGTVYQLLLARIPDMVTHPAFKSDVLNPLQMDRLMDLE